MMRASLFLLWLAPLFLWGQPPAADASAELKRLFASEWEYQLEQDPTLASFRGDKRYNTRWPDVSVAATDARHRHDVALLERLRSFDAARLTPADRLNLDLFTVDVRQRVEEHPYRWFLVPLTQMGGIQNDNELADAMTFASAKDYQDWLARLRALPQYMEQVIALMRQGVRERRLLPRVVLERVPAQVERQVVSDPAESPFFQPFRKWSATLPEAGRTRLTAEARQAVTESVVPAYRRLLAFLKEEYLPASLPRVGVWQVPDGDKLYALLVRRHTTTTLTPQQVHDLGLREVQRIRGEMERIKAQVGFAGTLPEFFQHLRTDPRFFYTTGDELLTAYRAMAKEIDPHLVRVFAVLPRTPYGVEPIPMAMAPDNTTAYYRPPALDGSRAGTYFVNLYRPEMRPRWEMMALSLHEAVPGHHLQIARAQELGDVPQFRREAQYTAFVEGWGLYAESLGDELGLYRDPYSKFGQLTYEMWRAVRLVVDTGIHALRWDREKAIAFFRENAPKTELDIANEVDRYIAWPGQALAYKVGELKIKELRQRAQHARGAKFDVRQFHEVVLRSGAVPLTVLEKHVDEWVKSGAGSQPAADAHVRPQN